MTAAIMAGTAGCTCSSQEKELQSIIESTVEKYDPLFKEANLAYWNGAISGKAEDFEAYSQANMKLTEILSDAETFSKLKEIKESGKVSDPVLKRELEILYNMYLSKQADTTLLHAIIQKEMEIEQKYSGFRALYKGKSIDDNQVENILKTSLDSKELESVWKAHKQIGKVVSQDIIEVVKLSNKPQDEDHDYGHGKYETLATSLVGMALLFVGVMILYSGAENIYRAISGEVLRQPGLVALFAAIISVVLKEWAYRFTIRTGQKVNSQAVIANAWHHRSDAFSSIGTSLGIGGAIFLGDKWVVLDPIAAVIVSLFIIKTACVLIKRAFDELLEKSLPAEIEAQIMTLAEQEAGVSEIHNLRTRRIGNHIAMEMHLRMSGDTSLYIAHQRTCEIEKRLREHFGADTLINIHVEPIKIAGRYVAPDNV